MRTLDARVSVAPGADDGREGAHWPPEQTPHAALRVGTGAVGKFCGAAENRVTQPGRPAGAEVLTEAQGPGAPRSRRSSSHAARADRTRVSVCTWLRVGDAGPAVREVWSVQREH